MSIPNATLTDDLSRQHPDWRWRRADRLLDECRRHRTKDDAIVRLALAYLRWRTRAEGCRFERPAPRRFAALEAAWRLRHGEDQRRRWLTEAYLLAKQAPDAIAVLCGLSAQAIAFYRDLFYDVERWLPAGDALMEQLVLQGRERCLIS